MSQEQMTQEEAALLQNLYVPAFVEKCAELGREIPDEETLDHAMQLTARVKQAVQEKGSNTIKQANLDLMQATGADVAEAEEAKDTAVKAAARKIGADPNYRKILLRAAQNN